MKEYKRFTMSEYRIPEDKEEVHPNFRLLYNCLAELEDKIENGTLIELPKKCYWVVDILGWVIIEYDIQKISYSFENNKINYIHCKECNSRSYKYFDSKDLDDDLFLTKAEAEAKLRELQGDK